MSLPAFEYVEPESLKEACRLLETQGAQAHVLAGGTDLLAALKERTKDAALLVDLHAIPHLDQIRYSDEGGLTVGALVTLQRLATDPLVTAKYPILAQAALSVGSPQLRAMGTVGGNLCQDTHCMFFNRPTAVRESVEPCHKLGGAVCHVVSGSDDCWATYAGDVAPALMVLGARVKIAQPAGETLLPLHELFSFDGHEPHTLRRGQLVSEVQVPPPPPRAGGVYLKLRQRETLDYPLLGVAVHLEMEEGDDVCLQASVALTAVDKAPVSIEAAGNLAGKKQSLPPKKHGNIPL